VQGVFDLANPVTGGWVTAYGTYRTMQLPSFDIPISTMISSYQEPSRLDLDCIRLPGFANAWESFTSTKRPLQILFTAAASFRRRFLLLSMGAKSGVQVPTTDNTSGLRRPKAPVACVVCKSRRIRVSSKLPYCPRSAAGEPDLHLTLPNSAQEQHLVKHACHWAPNASSMRHWTAGERWL
jgi:hypothetical protein